MLINNLDILAFFILLGIFFLWYLINVDGEPWNWPFLGNLPSLLRHVHRVHDRCAFVMEQVGGTFELKGPWFMNMDLLATADPANVHFIMSENFVNFPKGGEFKKIFDVLGDGIFNSDGDSWKSQRKQARTLITHDHFRRFLIRTSISKVEKGLVPVLDMVAEKGIIIDLQDIFQRFTFDTTCILVTGYDPGCLSVDLPDVPFSAAMDAAEEAIFMRHIFPESLWKIGKFIGIGPEQKLKKARSVLDSVINNYIALKRREISKSIKNSDQGIDLLTSYINGEESIDPVNDDKFLRDTILNFMIAGRDTTSSALTWFLWLVTTHPEIEKKIREELNSIIPTNELQKWRLFKPEELYNLNYLHSTLCESLRLYPPVPFQHKSPVEPVVLPSGHRVHPNMKVMFSMYSMGRMDYIWGKDSKEFKPERWITERGTIKYEPSYKFMAFNAGPRTCIGKEVAFTQLKCVASAILHNYQIEMMKGHDVSPNVSVILYMKHGFKVKVTKRWS